MSINTWSVLVAFLLTLLGGIVSIHPPSSKRSKFIWVVLILVVGVSSVVLILKQQKDAEVQQRAAEKSQSELRKEIDQIKSNTMPKPQHASVDFVSPEIVPQFGALYPFVPNQRIRLSIGYRNTGQSPIRIGILNAKLAVLPREMGPRLAKSTEMLLMLRKNLSTKVDGASVAPSPVSGDYHGFIGPVLSQTDAARLNSGQSMLCAVSLLTWSDGTGAYETDGCQCLASEGLAGFNWRNEMCHNSERKLE